MIELRHLRTLVALKESGSLAAAAKKRFVTQSALSHQIKELETRINSAIFVRKSKPLSFTQEGARLLNLAETILPQVIATESDLKQGLTESHDTLKVGIECHSSYRWLMPLIDAFKRTHPHTEVELVKRHLHDSLNALEAGELDLVLTSAPMPGQNLAYQHLFDFEIKLAVAVDHPLASKHYALPQELADEPLLSYPTSLQKLDIYKHFLEPAGVKPGTLHTSDVSHLLLQKVAAREGVIGLPSWAIKDAHSLNLKTIKLGQEGLKRPLFGAYRRDTANSRLVQDWLETLAHNGTTRLQ